MESWPERWLPAQTSVTPSTRQPLDAYAGAALMVAEVDVASVSTAADRALAMERVVVGTVLHEPLLLALGRLAQAHVSAELDGKRNRT